MFHLPSCPRTMIYSGLAILAIGHSSARAQAQTNPNVATTRAANSASQPASASQPPATSPVAPIPTIDVPTPPQALPADQTASDPSVSAKKTYEVPAGTKVLLELRSAIDTRSAKPGDGVYLSSTFPVVVGNRVMIPSGVYVQGMVDNVTRAGRIRGRAQLDMHFTSIIFPNGSVVEVPGMVNNLPGAKDQTVKNDGEGTIEQNPDKTRNAGKVAEVTIPTGATIGTIGGIAGGHPIAGSLGGVGAGLAAMGLVSLFTRGADVSIPSGTQVEMILQRPLLLEEANLAGVNAPGTAPTLVPAPNQPKPLEKPRPRILCPPGALGCG
jgi:hypothetical protein